MMTCRQLCALLVLALCCCPSVCAAESSQVPVKDSPTPSLTQSQGTGASGATNTSTTSSSAVPSAASPGKSEGSVAQGSPGAGQAPPENPSVVTAPAGIPGPTIPVPITKEVPGGSGSSVSPGPVADTVQKNGDNDTTDSKSGNNPSTDQTDQEAYDSAKKTTAATINTAPTTTTTRAPSRLREVDGSLSSSAWVCAPLLLAASALAYTTLG
ncbi:mucin TcMUCII [Trypanosoma cruzi cruzi]|uniref:Putative mucin TcMUCII n=1 Tax=Trypanosoma cruzi TaxID=5693 RepID=A0A2V2W6M9_TRYCR|nr:mucin TcMUCII [Trypanosoma cruzi cruzi]PWV03179.1 putative mucin TcMUCII [Trypanosoma cruzi]